MLRELSQQLRSSLMIFLVLTVLTGVLYPVLMTGIGQLFFSKQANGSLITQNGVALGSSLIGQSFTQDKYFWGRPSATSPYPYNAAASGASNLGPTNPQLLAAVKARVIALQESHHKIGSVPVDLVTASASGLDPEISPAAAYYQAQRVAQARGLSLATVDALIQRYTSHRQFGFMGEPRVNVLELNLALDKAHV